VWAEVRQDNVPLLAGGVAFFALLALVPGLIALISVYGLIAEPAQIQEQVEGALEAAPTQVRDLVSQQLASISASAEGSAIAAAIVGLLLALWSASTAMSHLIEAINTAYDEDEGRNFVRRRGLSLVLTLGAMIFVVFALAVIAAAPALLDSLNLGPVATVVAWIVRWLVLLGGMLVVLAIMYRIAPDRDAAEWRWVSPGAIIATIAWLIASVLFSLYTSNFGSYNETYGSLAAVVVLMLWLLLTAVVVISGAELNAELERQTREDTTTGASEPMGRRGAYAADTLGETRDELKGRS